MVVCFLHFFSCIRKPSGKDNRFHMADTIINMRRTYRHGVNVKETISHLQNERMSIPLSWICLSVIELDPRNKTRKVRIGRHV
jgi:hypothetical protein